MKVKEIYQLIDTFAPFHTAESYDNCGLLIGSEQATVNKIGLALDITNPIIDLAIQQQIDLIVTHHPLIFHPLKQILAQTPVYRLIQHGISHIAAHTNLDKAEQGTNTVLAERYELTQVTTPECLENLGRMGQLQQPLPLEQYINRIKCNLGCDGIRCYDAQRPVHRVVSISGSGAGAIKQVLALGADTFITGDIKHDVFVEAQNVGLNLIEVNHFDAENQVLPALKETLETICKAQEIEVVILSVTNQVKII